MNKTKFQNINKCIKNEKQKQALIDCKGMATPMALNLKLLSDASSEMVDAMMYC